MKIISWNIRGMGSRSKRRVIKEKILTSKADVVILQETKKEVIHRKLIGSIWGVRYTDWVSLPSLGSSGGILVMWKTNSISVMEAVIGIFSVSIKIQAINGQDWWLSGVYGPNKVRDKDDFWEELAGVYGLCGPRWCVGGDFNVVRFPSEKSNGGRMTRKKNSKSGGSKRIFRDGRASKLMKKLKFLKGKVKQWSKEEFRELGKVKQELEAKLIEIDLEEGRGGLDDTQRREREALRFQFEELVFKEEAFWRQRAKVEWAREGDGNTRFFHKCSYWVVAPRSGLVWKHSIVVGGVIDADYRGPVGGDVVQPFRC
ncbi:hypothetical protein M0R45_027274 [Rubus argutus]|uniref:Endonuclease/exonuclease/phosphatase domain-containing protein n=1 Tax=Rubus argutus TaxID=59490 RepID=A0AAW1WZY0_RUBAR